MNTHAFGPALGHAELKQNPEDFVVEEVMGFEPDGEGQHVWLWIEKRNENTPSIARQLAELVDIPRRDVGYSGMKDRLAITRQWFSVDLAGRPEPNWSNEVNSDTVKVLSTYRHTRKLRTGTHQGNRFILSLRDIDFGQKDAEIRLQDIKSKGVPNFFGAQRFGRDNLSQARIMLEQGQRIKQRQKRSMLFSTARAYLFNEVLNQRVKDKTWFMALPGECLQLDGSHSIFTTSEIDAELKGRVGSGDVHPTGPLWGRGDTVLSGESLAVEMAALAGNEALMQGLERQGLTASRRSLRLLIKDFLWEWREKKTLRLSFYLPAGGYATTVIGQLCDV